jgi:hypothetical protein
MATLEDSGRLETFVLSGLAEMREHGNQATFPSKKKAHLFLKKGVWQKHSLFPQFLVTNDVEKFDDPLHFIDGIKQEFILAQVKLANTLLVPLERMISPAGSEEKE